MTAPVSGLQSLNGVQVAYIDRPEATAEDRSGDPADPRHGIRGEQARPYSWESQQTPAGSHGPYGPENQLLGDPEWVWEGAGEDTQDPYMDLTPSTRAAPWPKGIASGRVPGETPDDIALQLSQSYAIHAIDMGASRKMVTSQQGDAQQDQWQELWEINPGSVDQQALADQYKSSGFMYGTTDRNQSFARQNAYGFDSKHMHRRYATGSIPGNTMWMRPGERPMVKHTAGTAKLPVGSNSPFAGDSTTFDFQPYGAVLMDDPTEYVAPPEPYLAPALAPSEYVPEESWY